MLRSFYCWAPMLFLLFDWCVSACMWARLLAVPAPLLERKFVCVRVLADSDGVALVDFSCKYSFANAVFNIVLYGTFQWACAELDVVSLRSNKFFCLVGDGDVVPEFLYTLEQTAQFDVDNQLDGSEVELVEGDDFVQTVQKFGCKLLAQAFLYDGTSTLLVLFVVRKSVDIRCCEAYALSKFLQLACTRIRPSFRSSVRVT